MTTLNPPAAVRAERAPSPLAQLTRLELRRYARHPLFLIGVVLTVGICVVSPDPHTSSFYDTIVPAAALGVLGLVAMAGLTRSAATFQHAAGAAPVSERTQTAALALTCLLPFAIGVAWFAEAVVAYHQSPPTANGFPFGDMSTSWKCAQLFGEGALSSLGGPLLGIVVGRWWPRRGTAPLISVLLVAATIVMQGLFVPLRRIRVFMPFTYFGGQTGGNGDHWQILTGSPQWWVAYLLCLCGLAVVAALWHDPNARTSRLRAVGAGLLAAAVVCCLLAMFTGVSHTLTNPLPL